MLALKLNKPKKLRKKEKNSSKKFKGTGLKIVDTDDFGFGSNANKSDSEEEAEELPQIAALVDDRPEEVKALENFRKENKWKTIAATDDDLHPQGSTESSRVELPTLIERKRHDSESDTSLPIRQRHDSDESLPKRNRQNSDIFPPRRRPHDSDDSPSRRKRYDSDASPPRRKRHDSDASPPRRNHDSDNSPPRRKRHDSDESPPRRNRRGSGENRSPSNRRYQNSRKDLSPPRRRQHGQDLSPLRKNRDMPGSSNYRSSQNQSSSNSRMSSHHTSYGDEDEDLSLPRRKNHNNHRNRSPSHKQNDRDLSPPRNRKRHFGKRRKTAPEVVEYNSDSEDKLAKTLGGKKAGLQKGGALKGEMDELRRKEDELFAALDDSVTGRNAKTRVGAAKERALAEEATKKKDEEEFAAERKKQYDKWGKGLKQVEEQNARVHSAIHEMSKPLARSKDDQDLDDHLRSLDRDGDPMLKFISKKKGKANNKPMYLGPPPPPNRFHIPPGYRWDGVDRSNGYEKQWFGRINSRKALQEESYKWSVEDL